ncbi:MAG: DUF4445 domain-containing protein [Clostridia bacterium]|nr:DUF4445 domain-containing protein [Clostridia bacterium]
MPENVIIHEDGKPISALTGRKLRDYLSMEFPCGGHGKCGKCKVRAEGGLLPAGAEERMLLSAQELEAGIRLACLAEICGECTVETTPVHGMQESRIVSGGTMPDIRLQPAFHAYGAAVDIGTTTLAARLYDMQGRMLSEETRINPQTAWGADVISRIEAALKGQAKELRCAIASANDAMILSMAKKAHIHAEEIDGLVITGNSAMLFLLTGTDTACLARAPFRLERRFGGTCSAKDAGITCVSPEAEVYFPPCVSAFVGADIACAALAVQLCTGTETKLLVDIGTNGEICLWHRGKLYVASTAAGPAFEGVGISAGMRAEAGAIDRVYAEDGRLQVHVISDAPARGICGSGLVDAVAALLELDLLDETGALDGDSVEIGGGISLTQKDIRMMQLAKGAISAGIRTLLETAQASDVSALEIAGGFGKYIHTDHAVRIGLLPREAAKRVNAAGNAALSGASMLLLSREMRAACESMVRQASVVELSSNPVFARHYMSDMLL